ncbi:hypothetical protein DYB30_007476 [Aphanomyces astaci]|uniref:Uncharacterized protein n=3 Tax=Aphanomyces astaci TaxID=112090 RepID=A0A397DI16_APHAT|nr:hypothetical protein DYB30_007476 [Aphanomyces astaci]
MGRCFPHCCKGHKKKTFCGTGVGVETDLPDCTSVLSYFSCHGDPGSTPDKDECPVQFQVGHTYNLLDFETHVKSKDNLFGSVFPGQRVGSSRQFVINGDRQCWHYGWCSSRVGQKYTHCLNVYFFKVEADTKLECIDAIESDPFHITSSRVMRKKTRLAKRTIADVVGSIIDKAAESSSGHSDAQIQSKRVKSTSLAKRDLICLLNPNEAAAAAAANITLPPTPSLPPIIPVVNVTNRRLQPDDTLQARSNDVFFIIQILSRIADFERLGSTQRQYFSLTMHHLFSVQPLLAKPPPSPPRIPHGSMMESLLSVLVAGVESALEAGFLSKLRDHILTHPHDPLKAYSDMLGMFEQALVALGGQFPTTCDTVAAMAKQLHVAFSTVIGHKHKSLLPEHEYVPETPPTTFLDSLYMGREFASAVMSALHVPQWSPTSRNVQGDFSPLSGKWARLSLQCRTQPQHHPSWLYRLLTDVASRTWSIDDRGDEMLVCKPPTDQHVAKTPMEKLMFPADWHVESSSIDTYARAAAE